MQSPFRRLEKALRLGRKKNVERSRHVELYEMLAFILVVPSMLVLQVGFVLVVCNIWLASQISRNRLVIASLGVFLINIVSMPLVYFKLLGSEFELNISFVFLLVVVMSLTAMSLKSMFYQLGTDDGS